MWCRSSWPDIGGRGFFGNQRRPARFLAVARAAFARSPGMIFFTIIFVVPLMTIWSPEGFFTPDIASWCLRLCFPWRRWRPFDGCPGLEYGRFSVPALADTWRQCLAGFGDIPISGKVHRTRKRCLPKLSQSRNCLPVPEAHAGKNRLIRVEDDDYMRTMPSNASPVLIPTRFVNMLPSVNVRTPRFSAAIQTPVLTYKIFPAEPGQT